METKKKAEAVSLLTQGKVHVHAESKQMSHLSLQHYYRQHDLMHKIRHRIIEWRLQHRVGTLVIPKIRTKVFQRVSFARWIEGPCERSRIGTGGCCVTFA